MTLTETRQPKTSRPDLPLTPRQKQIVSLVGKAYSNQQIALELNMSVNTVKNQLLRIFDRLRINDRVTLALMVERGQI